MTNDDSSRAPSDPLSDHSDKRHGNEDERAPRPMIIVGSLVVLAAIVVICAGIKAAQTIVGPFCLACFLAIILTVPLRWLKSKGLSDFLAAVVVCAGVLFGGGLIIWILSGTVNQFLARVPEYTVKFNQTLESIDDFLEPHGFSLLGGPKETKHPNGQNGNGGNGKIGSSETGDHDAVTPISAHLPKDPDAEPATAVPPEEGAANPPPESEEGDEISFLPPDIFGPEEQAAINTVGIVGYLRWGATELTRLAAVCFIVMILVVFMMFETSRLPAKLVGAFGERALTNPHLQMIIEKVWKYMRIKSIISFFVGFFVWILLISTGVEYAALWALIAFFLNFIPNIGSIIAVIPGAALALFDGGVGTFVIVGIGYLLINQTLGYYVEPIFLGDGLGISPLVVLLSLVFWGWLLGMIGMFLSAPLTIVLKIVLGSFEETRWISVLMDDKYKPQES